MERRLAVLAVVVGLAGCGEGSGGTTVTGTPSGTNTGDPWGTATGGGTGSGTGGGTGSGTGSGTGTGTGTGPCVELPDGRWTAAGAAFGMPMEMTLTMNAAECRFTITEWDMVMGSLPDSGETTPGEVWLNDTTGDAYWQSCHGTFDAGTGRVDGICDDDGSGWGMQLN